MAAERLRSLAVFPKLSPCNCITEYSVSAVTFIELPVFTELISDLVDDTSYARFQNELLRQSASGDVMHHAGGLRKVRLCLPGRGKSGGAQQFSF